MFTITNILNPITGGSTTEEYTWEKGKPLSGYLGFDGECAVACNKVKVDLPLDAILPARGETYIVLPMPEGMDRQEMRLVSYSALAIVNFIPGWGPIASFIGSMAVNLFLRDKKEDLKDSSSYSWRFQSSQTAAFGSAMPVVYGKARVRPVLKNRYVKVNGDKQELYALYGVAAHRVDERILSEYGSSDVAASEVRFSDLPGFTLFNDRAGRANVTEPFSGENDSFGDGWHLGRGTASFANDILVNGRNIGDYGDDVEWETRPGLPEQTVIAGFDATYVNFAQNTSLYIDYPSIEWDAAIFNFSTTPMVVEWKEHDLFLGGTARRIKAGSIVFSPADIGFITYVYYDPGINDVDTLRYKTWRQQPAAPTTGYLIYSFKVNVSSFTQKTKYTRSELPNTLDWVHPLSVITNTHNIEIILEFPIGLFQSSSGSETTTERARLFAQYRQVGSATWLNFNPNFGNLDGATPDESTGITTFRVERNKTEAFNVSMLAVDPDGVLLNPNLTYELRVTAAVASIINLVNVATVVYGAENAEQSWPGFTYPGEPLIGIKALASGQVNSELDVQVDVERSEVWVLNTRFTATYTKTDIRFLAEEDQFGTLSHINQTTTPPVDGWFDDIFTANTRLTVSGSVSNDGTYWISVVGHDYLTLLNVDVVSEAPGADVTLSTVGKWVTGAANNHAWAVYDLLVQGNQKHPAYPTAGNADADASYGAGIDPERVDYESFRTWAEHVFVIGYQLNGVFDTFTTAWDAILRICQEGRGMVYPIGLNIYAFTDKAADPTQLFTMGNIHEDTFVQKYMETASRTNLIEADYFDAEKNYIKTAISVRTAAWDSEARLSVPTKVTLYFTTGFAQAQSIIRFILLGNELINDVITFGMDVDSLTAQAGDVVEVQHDLLDTGEGGRIVAYDPSNNTVTLDKEIDMVEGTAYKLQVKHADGTTETHTVSPRPVVANGNMELDDASWSLWHAPAIERSSEQAQSGTYSKKITLNPDGEQGGISQTISDLVIGFEYTVIEYFRGKDLAIGFASFRALSDPGGVTLDTSNGAWVIATYDFIATTTSVQLYAILIGTAIQNSNASYYVDTVSFEVADKRQITVVGPWTIDPEQYDVYSFGIAGSHTAQYRITEISRTNELMRTLTLAKYDPRIYLNYIPSDPTGSGEFTGPTVGVPGGTTQTGKDLLNLASNVRLKEVWTLNETTGKHDSLVVATWDTAEGDPRGQWDVWFRDVDASDLDWQGAFEDGQSYSFGDKVELDGATYLSLTDENTETPG